MRQHSKVHFVAAWLLTSASIFYPLQATAEVLDQVVATVGEHCILRSELQDACAMHSRSGLENARDLECKVLEKLIMNKLLLYKASQEDITVQAYELEAALSMRLEQILQMADSLERAAAAWGGGDLQDFKNYLKKMIREQILVQRMTEKICGNLQAAPAEVKDWFDSTHAAERPCYPDEVTVRQLWIYPTTQDAEMKRMAQALETIREECLQGASLQQVAENNPQLEAPIARKGILGKTGLDGFETQYEAVIRGLKPGQVSSPIVTNEGGYLIQLLAIAGKTYQSQYVQMRPSPETQDIQAAQSYLEKVRRSILCKDVTFEQACSSFSRLRIPSDVDAYSDSPIAKDELPGELFFALEQFKPGDVSPPQSVRDAQGCQALRLLTYTVCVPAHEANLAQDYDKIKEAFLLHKREETIKSWFERARKDVLVKVASEYTQCNTLSRDRMG